MHFHGRVLAVPGMHFHGMALAHLAPAQVLTAAAVAAAVTATGVAVQRLRLRPTGRHRG